MDGTEFRFSLERLRECMHSRDNDEIENVLADLDSFMIEVESWPDGFFNSLVGLMRDPNFLGLTNSWKLFCFITSNWEQISEDEKERFREVLGEILGEHYAEEVTLAILARLAKTASLLTQQLLPHALEYFAKATQREALRSLAMPNRTPSYLGFV